LLISENTLIQAEKKRKEKKTVFSIGDRHKDHYGMLTNKQKKKEKKKKLSSPSETGTKITTAC